MCCIVAFSGRTLARDDGGAIIIYRLTAGGAISSKERIDLPLRFSGGRTPTRADGALHFTWTRVENGSLRLTEFLLRDEGENNETTRGGAE